MRKRRLPFLVFLAGLLTAGMSLSSKGFSPQDFRSGKDFLPVSVYSAGEDQELLQLFSGRRELYEQLRLPPDASIKK